MKKSLTILLGAALLMGGYVGYAADAVYELNPVVVTAQRNESKEFDTQANITVITRKEIENRHYTDLGEVLKDVPGVNIQNYGASGENYTSNRLYINGSANLVVLVDGMRANVNGSSSGVLSPSEYANMDTIERVEVLKGSAATLYGSDAVGGVINIITRKDKKEGVHSTLNTVTGSYGKRTIRFTNQGKENGVYWLASAQQNSMGDFTDGHGNTIIHNINTHAYDIMLGKELGKDSTLTFKYDKYKSNYTRPKNGGLKETVKNVGSKDNDKISLQWEQRLNDHLKNSLYVYRNNNVLHDGTNQPSLQQWHMDLTTDGFTEQLTFTDDHNTLVAGYDYYQDKINHYSSWGDIYDGKKISNKALFLQEDYKFADHWNITPGIRYTKNSKSGSKTTKSIALGYNNGKVNAYTAYKEFFVVPNQSQLFSKYGNPNLKPSDGHTVEAGINYDFGNQLVANFNVYKTKADCIISGGYDAAGNYKYFNALNEKSDGWSLGLKKVFSDRWSTNVAYTYTHIPAASEKVNPNRDGYIPKGQVNLTIDYTIKKFNAELTGRGIYDRPGRKASEAKALKSIKNFWIFDATLNYRASKDFGAFIKVSNLEDKFYTDQIYLADPESTNWYSAPGRNYQMGVEFKF